MDREWNDSQPIYRQLRDRVVAMILDGVLKEGVACFGALAIGNLKMKVHKACIGRLFERNDLVLDAETIADVARELMAPTP